MKLMDLSYSSMDGSLFPPLILSTDSSLSLNSRPVFPPEISDRWSCRVSAAYRICRLGKTIGERFASRYYDAMTLSARIVPVDLAEEMEQKGLALSPFITAFDGAVSIGQWTNIPAGSIVEISSPCSIETIMPNPAIDRAIALLSRHFILKTGDIIIPGQPIAEFPVKIGDSVSISTCATPVLTFRIK